MFDFERVWDTWPTTRKALELSAVAGPADGVDLLCVARQAVAWQKKTGVGLQV